MESRINNATRNIVFGFLLNIYQIFIPFIIRTLMIYLLGMEYLGLNGLFASVLSVLNLAELGIGTAMVYSMYKPIAVEDKTMLCALLKLYKIYYRFIGGAIGIAGLCLMPFIKYLIKGDIPADINIYILYIMHLSATVLSYWVFAYKRSLLQAYQRTDLIDKTNMVITTVQYLFQLLAVLITRSYYVYVLLMLGGQVFKNLATAYVATKRYPDIHPDGDIDELEKARINQRIRDIFAAKLGGIIYGSADSIVISMFMGLRDLAIYDNYMYILNSIAGFISVVFTSVTASVGNSLVLESKEKNHQDFQTFNFIVFWICGFCSACFICIYEPFMHVWAGQENSMGMLYVVFLVMYFYFVQYNDLLHMYKNASGIWSEDKYRPLITSIINLVLDIILVQHFGLLGIIFGTWASMAIVGIPWLVTNIFHHVFIGFSLSDYVKKMLMYIISVVLACVLCFVLCSLVNISDYVMIVIALAVCIVVPNLIFFVCFRKTKEFEHTLDLFDAITRGKLLKITNLVRKISGIEI
ncbi:MAG: lipopolysaccharide biosynthesis protein [Erysipelotrichaceae bacterium]